MIHSDLKFSIIIPTYNRETYIARAIHSIISQDYQNWELLIIDNLSTDNTLSIINQFQDYRIRVYVNDKNYERCYSRNRGINFATGDYILFLDSDDYFENDHLKNWVYVLSNLKNCSNFLICNKKIIENDSIVFGNSHENKHHFINDYNYIFNQIVLPGQVCLKNELLKKFEFNENYLLFEDTALWLQIMTEEVPLFFDFYSFVYIQHENNSVNWKNSNYGKIRLKSLKNFILENKSIINIIGRKIFIKELMITNFIIAKHHIFIGDKLKAIYYLLKSIIFYPISYQLKHRVLLILRLIINRNFDYIS